MSDADQQRSRAAVAAATSAARWWSSPHELHVDDNDRRRHVAQATLTLLLLPSPASASVSQRSSKREGEDALLQQQQHPVTHHSTTVVLPPFADSVMHLLWYRREIFILSSHDDDDGAEGGLLIYRLTPDDDRPAPSWSSPRSQLSRQQQGCVFPPLPGSSSAEMESAFHLGGGTHRHHRQCQEKEEHHDDDDQWMICGSGRLSLYSLSQHKEAHTAEMRWSQPEVFAPTNIDRFPPPNHNLLLIDSMLSGLNVFDMNQQGQAGPLSNTLRDTTMAQINPWTGEVLVFAFRQSDFPSSCAVLLPAPPHHRLATAASLLSTRTYTLSPFPLEFDRFHNRLQGFTWVSPSTIVILFRPERSSRCLALLCELEPPRQTADERERNEEKKKFLKMEIKQRSIVEFPDELVDVWSSTVSEQVLFEDARSRSLLSSSSTSTFGGGMVSLIVAVNVGSRGLVFRIPLPFPRLPLSEDDDDTEQRSAPPIHLLPQDEVEQRASTVKAQLLFTSATNSPMCLVGFFK